MSAARRLRIAPTAAEVLADEISAICEQIDRRLGNPSGVVAAEVIDPPATYRTTTATKGITA